MESAGLRQYMFCAVELWGAFFCVVAAFVAFLTRHGDKHKAYRLVALMLCCAAQLCAEAFTWLLSQSAGIVDTGMASATEHIARFATYLFAYATLALAVRYVSYLIEQHCDNDLSVWVRSEYLIVALGVTCLVCNEQRPFMFTYDYLNRLVRLEYYWLLGILALVGLGFALGVVMLFFDELKVFDRVAVASMLALPFVAIVLQLVLEGFSFVCIAITISTMVLFFARQYDYAQRSIELERKLSAMRIKVLGQQIKPHFIFNCLSLIRYMSRRQPEEVTHAIDEFSLFLRGCTDLLNNDARISAKEEFDLVKHYAYLQERRFEGELCVEYDLRDTDFELPAFSVQTSVENAITHGIRKQLPTQNGRVVVRSYLDGGVHVVEVEDNGVGFNTSILSGDKDGHTGISSTRERVRIMCEGTYTISSTPGKGTVATIRVPA